MPVNTDGAKYWRMDYRFAGTRCTLAFGKYPEVTLANTHDKRLSARKLLDQDIDPSEDKEDRARTLAEEHANMFEKLAQEWHSNKLPTWSVATAHDTLRRLEINIFPEVGSMPTSTSSTSTCSARSTRPLNAAVRLDRNEVDARWVINFWFFTVTAGCDNVSLY